jgi:hypothetical protein
MLYFTYVFLLERELFLSVRKGDKGVKPCIENGNLEEGWTHIDARHVTGNHPYGAGDLFASGTTRAQLEQVASNSCFKYLSSKEYKT